MRLLRMMLRFVLIGLMSYTRVLYSVMKHIVLGLDNGPRFYYKTFYSVQTDRACILKPSK